MSPVAPGDFDVYLLAQSWAPHFCCTNAERCTTVPWAFSAKHLSLHGLWPGFTAPRGEKAHTFPSACKTKAKLLDDQPLPREYVDVAPAFTTWDAAQHRATLGDLARHEWRKHGTCSGLGPAEYFAEALRAMSLLPGDRGTPAALSAHVGGSVSAAELRSAYAKRVALRADRSCRLAEVTTCWSKLADGRVGAQVDCPDHVMRGRDSPKCSSLLVTQLGQCLAADAAKKRGRRSG